MLKMANKDVIALKESKVNELSNHIKESKLVLLVDYRGITVADDTKLRKDVKEANGEIKVVKNNIIKRALDANGRTNSYSIFKRGLFATFKNSLQICKS